MKDKAIYLLGELEKERIKAKEEVDYLIEHPYLKGEFYGLILNFKVFNDNENSLQITYERADLKKFDDDTYKKLAYKEGTARGGDITATTKLSIEKNNDKKTLKNIEKKLNSIIQNSLTNLKKFYDKKDYEESKYFDLLLNELKKNENKYKNEIFQLIKDFHSKESKNQTTNLVISIKLNDKYLYDYKVIKDYIKDQSLKNKYYSQTLKATSKAEDKVCSVTMRKEKEIFGFAYPEAYATIDKPGMVPNFFSQKENWKNYPISKEAALLLELGFRLLLRDLSSHFYGFNYFALPSPIVNIKFEIYQNLIKRFEKIFADENKDKETKAKIEDIVMKNIAQEQNYFTVDLVFYKRENSAFRILKYIEQILPSRFRTLFVDIPKEINNKPVFLYGKQISKKQRKKENKIKYEKLNFNFGIIKTFFKDIFLDVVHKAFLGDPISKEFLFDNIMKAYRKNYNDIKAQKAFEIPYNLITKALMTYFYFTKLGILEYNKKFKYMETQENQTNQGKQEKRFLVDEFNKFIKDHQEFFDSEEKIGLFALGILIKYVMNIQSSNLSSTPFEKKLHGYNLNPELIQYVYNEAINKLVQYGGQYIYSDLREIIAEKLVLNFTKLKRLSNNELSFYVVAGIELGNKFKKQSDNTEQNKNNG